MCREVVGLLVVFAIIPQDQCSLTDSDSNPRQLDAGPVFSPLSIMVEWLIHHDSAWVGNVYTLLISNENVIVVLDE